MISLSIQTLRTTEFWIHPPVITWRRGFQRDYYKLDGQNWREHTVSIS